MKRIILLVTVLFAIFIAISTNSTRTVIAGNDSATAQGANGEQGCHREICLTLAPSDPAYATQYGPQRIAAPQAWDITTGSSNTIIAIVDTGIDCTHPELIGRCVPGWDFVNGHALTGTENSDDYGHGTHVASIAAGNANNAIGIAGICWNCRLMPIKVLDASGGGDWNNLAFAIRYAADSGATVINMSLGGPDPTPLVADATNYAFTHGAIEIASCGNTGNPACLWPAAYPNVLSVSCSDANDVMCSFSSRGYETDVSAPGLDIYAAVPTGTCNLCDPSGYRLLSGTSMSAPHVSGVAGLIRSAHPEYSAEQTWGVIEAGADDKSTSGFDYDYGFGRLNSYRSLLAAPVARLAKPAGGQPPPFSLTLTEPVEGQVVSGNFRVCGILVSGQQDTINFFFNSQWKSDYTPKNGQCVGFSVGSLSKYPGSYEVTAQAVDYFSVFHSVTVHVTIR